MRDKTGRDYERLFNFSLDMLAIAGFDGYFKKLNPAWEKTLGWTPRQLMSKPYFEFIHPEDRELTIRASKKLAEGKEISGFENRYLCADGSYKWLSWNSCSLPGEDVIFAVARDINSDKKAEEESLSIYSELGVKVQEQTIGLEKANKDLLRANRALRMLSGCNQMVVHAASELDLLNNVCKAFVELGGYRLAWVGYAERDEAKGIRPVAQAGFEEGYLSTVKITWGDKETGRGPVGTAIRTGRPSVVRSAAADPDFLIWRDEALKRGYSSIIGLPLKDDSGVFGVLAVYSSEDAFNEEEVNLLSELANDLAYGIRTLRERIEHEEAEASLRESEALLASFFDSPGVMRGIVEIVGDDIRHVSDNAVSAAFFGRTKESMRNQFSSALGIPKEETSLWIENCRKSRRNGCPVSFEYSRNAGAGARWFQATVSCLGTCTGSRFGYVVSDITERRFAEKKIRSQFRKLAALRDIDMAITSSLDLRVSIKIILQEVISQLFVDAADMLILDHHTLLLEYIGGQGFRTDALKHSRLRLGEGLAGRAAMEKNILHIADLSAEKNGFRRAPLLAGEGFVEYFAVPLISKGHVMGVLEIFHRSPINQDQEWMDFLQALGTQAAIAIDNAEMFTDLERSNTELTLAYDTTLEGWSRALDYRDKETEGHSRRVTDMTLKLAQSIGMNSEDILHARRGALLHDIGKLGVPDSILLKPGRLTDEEMAVMRKHPVIAYELLSPIAFLRKSIDIPYCHHEKWDGTGYPRKLRGEQIPLAARIFAIVDVYDALCSDRPYRLAWPKEKALEYIRGQAGSHFDPEIADKFLKMKW